MILVILSYHGNQSVHFYPDNSYQEIVDKYKKGTIDQHIAIYDVSVHQKGSFYPDLLGWDDYRILDKQFEQTYKHTVFTQKENI